MTARVYVASIGPLSRHLNIGFVNETSDGLYALKPALGTSVGVISRLEEGQGFPEDCVLVVSEEHGRALLQALVEHFQGADDTRALRRDYDHEKQRVDRLVDALIESNRRPSA